jgi:hypothetical protein
LGFVFVMAIGPSDFLAALVVILFAHALGLVPPVRRYYAGKAHWSAHLGWSLAGGTWFYVALLLASQGKGPLKVLGSLLVSLAYFAHGTRIGGAWRFEPAGRRRLAALLALGFLLASIPAKPLQDWLGLAWPALTPRAEDNAAWKDYLVQVFWIALAVVYGLTAVGADDVPAFFRQSPWYPPGVRRFVSVLARGGVLAAWLPALVWPWILHGERLAESALGPGQRFMAGVGVVLLPAYLALLVPAVGYARGLACKGSGTRPMDTEGRAELLGRLQPTIWLAMALGAVCVGDGFVAAHAMGVPAAIGLATIVARFLPMAAAAPDLGTSVVLIFAALVGQYLTLVELPYWRGQSRWRQAQLREARREAEAAQEALAAGVAAQARDPRRDRAALVLPLARQALALERVRRAADIPVHTFKSTADLFRKLASTVALSAATTVVSGKSPDGTGLLEELVRAIVGGLFKG